MILVVLLSTKKTKFLTIMKQITFLLLFLLSISIIAQEKANNDIVTNDLIEFMAQSAENDLIPINIILNDKYPTSNLFSQSAKLTRSEKRDFVKSELKTFSQQSQKSLRNFLSSKSSGNSVEG